MPFNPDPSPNAIWTGTPCQEDPEVGWPGTNQTVVLANLQVSTHMVTPSWGHPVECDFSTITTTATTITGEDTDELRARISQQDTRCK